MGYYKVKSEMNDLGLHTLSNNYCNDSHFINGRLIDQKNNYRP